MDESVTQGDPTGEQYDKESGSQAHDVVDAVQVRCTAGTPMYALCRIVHFCLVSSIPPYSKSQVTPSSAMPATGCSWLAWLCYVASLCVVALRSSLGRPLCWLQRGSVPTYFHSLCAARCRPARWYNVHYGDVRCGGLVTPIFESP